MPIIKSAKKKLRKDKVRTGRNLVAKKKYKIVVKAVKKSVASKGAKTKSLLSKASSLIDKAAKKRVIHKNKAARLKSRVAKSANKKK
ncbi:30S ribosomal protein S20 [Candidatus Roizmanbacteria bacterium RIFCSPHIGHO2_02_FULL_40_13b]|uniref:Small ribosomal subunit protein bS20 n=1 Tax=Candidatus Roizmanbacteria bacterium RIFCSPHIGHO2_01_FULL_39_24 TaxID=1802032 RepID=A0A1F7GLA4_9BACT|nr:MAG: 30S ribosomal protein S20 [Candidatus Roizmanbacteria bacterium RIFCSPHIGHO2_01_FULL_39_24]OGK26984.1 MAG: 30S ribosomal protein S20 [Candidatus Roizmanbacteria bacterium RIFCSPHIGHO2_02_FULL_40_13b]OGK48861.1 MAG: 30S ribosomal protein S20 [Candidatus Roizmanbacteria bacterium RIFCSPLOWO2_01_FULL_40_32]OGK57169.1 MAG: 30S ribosomal protein S20 [Candidatus Roizmanbacteria bacterium RIFCSPLOWO2_02_FULL_39_8]